MKLGVESGRENKVECFHLKCLSSMHGVTQGDEINIDIVELKTLMVRKLVDCVDSRVLRWFRLIVGMYDKRLVKRVMETQVSGRRTAEVDQSLDGWMA